MFGKRALDRARRSLTFRTTRRTSREICAAGKRPTTFVVVIELATASASLSKTRSRFSRRKHERIERARDSVLQECTHDSRNANRAIWPTSTFGRAVARMVQQRLVTCADELSTTACGITAFTFSAVSKWEVRAILTRILTRAALSVLAEQTSQPGRSPRQSPRDMPSRETSPVASCFRGTVLWGISAIVGLVVPSAASARTGPCPWLMQRIIKRCWRVAIACAATRMGRAEIAAFSSGLLVAKESNLTSEALCLVADTRSSSRRALRPPRFRSTDRRAFEFVSEDSPLGSCETFETTQGSCPNRPLSIRAQDEYRPLGYLHCFVWPPTEREEMRR